MKLGKYLWIYVPLVIVLTLDITSKAIAISTLSSGTTFNLLWGLVSLQLAHNTGIAFGFFTSYTSIILALVTILVLAGYFYIFKTEKRYHIPVSVVLAGALGNLLDRLMSPAGVTDFISIPSFAIFNFADIAITCGIGYIILVMMLEPLLKKRKKAQQTL